MLYATCCKVVACLFFFLTLAPPIHIGVQVRGPKMAQCWPVANWVNRNEMVLLIRAPPALQYF